MIAAHRRLLQLGSNALVVAATPNSRLNPRVGVAGRQLEAVSAKCVWDMIITFQTHNKVVEGSTGGRQGWAAACVGTRVTRRACPTGSAGAAASAVPAARPSSAAAPCRRLRSHPADEQGSQRYFIKDFFNSLCQSRAGSATPQRGQRCGAVQRQKLNSAPGKLGGLQAPCWQEAWLSSGTMRAQPCRVSFRSQTPITVHASVLKTVSAVSIALRRAMRTVAEAAAALQLQAGRVGSRRAGRQVQLPGHGVVR